MTLAGGVALVVVAGIATRWGMAGHMAGHMILVAVAAPLLALAARGGRLDPVRRWPDAVSPLAMSVVELGVVWGWHLPRLRVLVDAHPVVAALEQACFLIAGFLLWAAVLGTAHDGAARRAGGIAALFLISMHMTLLGALIGLAPRPLYPMSGHALEPLADQQLGGVLMLMIGAAGYAAGGLTMLGGLLRQREAAA